MELEKMSQIKKISAILFFLLIAGYCAKVSIRAIKEGKVHTKENKKNVTYYREATPGKFWLSVGISIFVSIAAIGFAIYISVA